MGASCLMLRCSPCFQIFFLHYSKARLARPKGPCSPLPALEGNLAFSLLTPLPAPPPLCLESIAQVPSAASPGHTEQKVTLHCPAGCVRTQKSHGVPQKSLPTTKPCLVPSPNEESPASRSGHRQCLQAPGFLVRPGSSQLSSPTQRGKESLRTALLHFLGNFAAQMWSMTERMQAS